MSRESVNSETNTEKTSRLRPGTVELSPVVEFFLLFVLTLIAALSLVLIF